MSDNREAMLASLLDAFLDRKTDSISLSKTSTGKFSWDIKIYNEDLLDDVKKQQVIDQLKKVNGELEAIFKGGEKP